MGLFDGFGFGNNLAGPLMGVANSRHQAGPNYADALTQSAQGMQPQTMPFGVQLGGAQSSGAPGPMGNPGGFRTGGGDPMPTAPGPITGGGDPMPTVPGGPMQQQPQQPPVDPRHGGGFAGAFLGGIDRLSGGAVGNALGQAGVPQSQYMGGATRSLYT